MTTRLPSLRCALGAALVALAVGCTGTVSEPPPGGRDAASSTPGDAAQVSGGGADAAWPSDAGAPAIDAGSSGMDAGSLGNAATFISQEVPATAVAGWPVAIASAPGQWAQRASRFSNSRKHFFPRNAGTGLLNVRACAGLMVRIV